MKLVLVSLLSLFLLLKTFTVAQFTCSATQPCEIGCCSKFGSCGLGPDSCGPENCISNCDRKSECDPGWGPQWSTTKSCPLNVCCSKFGFCGTTSEFCGDVTVPSPSCSGTSSSKRTIGYYEAWSVTRPCDKMFPEGIPTGSYTHLNFAFAFVNPSTFAVSPMGDDDPKLYTRFTALKNANPNLQTWISIGGWSMNDPDQPTATTFSDLAGSTVAQAKFFASTLSFLETYGFDGVDMDWEYPVAPERSGKPADYQNFVTFLQNFRNALHSTGHNYGLTITIPASFWYLQHFDIVAIEKTIDWFNIMSYDLHGTWDSTNKWLGPYIGAHTNLTEIDNVLSLLWRNNINPDNVVLGLGFYGRSFTLADPSCRTPGCVFTSGGDAGSCTQSVGTLSFAEIRRLVAAGAHVETDTQAAVKMVIYNTNQWVSYDDEDTFKMKIDYANSHCLGGTMVWAASTDDAQGSAAAALSRSTGRQALSLLSSAAADPITSCRLGECGKPCPAGLSPAQRSDGKVRGNTGTNTGCSGSDTRLYCCPSNDMPTCRWRISAPFCSGSCWDGEVEVSTSTTGNPGDHQCSTGHKVLCCTKTASNEAASQCQWKGTAPFCSGIGGQADCPSGQTAIAKSTFGSGGEQPCSFGSKSFCCNQPPPYENCEWSKHGDSYVYIPYVCAGTCPTGKSLVATDTTGCLYGSQAFCCDSPSTINDPVVADFKRRVEEFSSDPTCRADERIVAREESEESVEQPEKRSPLSVGDHWLLNLQVSHLASTGGQTFQERQMATVFDSLYGTSHGLRINNISSFLGDWPNADQSDLSNSLLCMGDNAASFLSDLHQGQPQLCVNPCAESLSSRATEKRSTPPIVSINPRVISDDPRVVTSGAQTLPSWGLMAQHIMEGRMQLVYEQVIRAQGGRETILEVVWRLPFGDGPGNIDPDYQDTATHRNNPDQFVVFHFHAHHIPTTTGLPNMTPIPGISAVNAFHGQFWGPGNTPRVDGNDAGDRNRRARILSCVDRNDPRPASQVPIQDLRFWYPGTLPDTHGGGMGPWADILTRFGNYLRGEGILTAATFTAPNRGQLTLNPPDPCGRQTFNWGTWWSSRQFMPDGSRPPSVPNPNNDAGPSTGPGTQADNDGV